MVIRSPLDVSPPGGGPHSRDSRTSPSVGIAGAGISLNPLFLEATLVPQLLELGPSVLESPSATTNQGTES